MSDSLSSQTPAEMPQPLLRPGIAIRPGLLRLVIVVVLLLGILEVGLAWGEIVVSGMDIQQDYVAAQRLRAGGNIYAPITPAEVSALGVIEENHTGMRLNAHPPLTA